jgi:hypothetical protein
VGTNHDYATVKYDSDGNQLWVARYNGPANGYDIAVSIASDIAENVYVTGESLGVGTDFDYATVKYDSDGNQLWVARYNGPGNSADAAISVVLDATANVYVTGFSAAAKFVYGYATVKYDSDGNQLWVARYDGQGEFDNEPSAMALDAAGNVYVTGQACPELGCASSDFATVKYAQE